MVPIVLCFGIEFLCSLHPMYVFVFIPPPKRSFKGGILFSRCPSVRPCVRASVRNVLFLYYLEDFDGIASVYLWGKYVHAKIKG